MILGENVNTRLFSEFPERTLFTRAPDSGLASSHWQGPPTRIASELKLFDPGSAAGSESRDLLLSFLSAGSVSHALEKKKLSERNREFFLRLETAQSDLRP